MGDISRNTRSRRGQGRLLSGVWHKSLLVPWGGSVEREEQVTAWVGMHLAGAGFVRTQRHHGLVGVVTH